MLEPEASCDVPWETSSPAPALDPQREASRSASQGASYHAPSVGLDGEEKGVRVYDADKDGDREGSDYSFEDLLTVRFWEEVVGPRVSVVDGANFQPHRISASQQYDEEELVLMKSLARGTILEFPSRSFARARREKYGAPSTDRKVSERRKAHDANTMIWFLQKHPEFSLREWQPSPPPPDPRIEALRAEIKEDLKRYNGLRERKPEEAAILAKFDISKSFSRREAEVLYALAVRGDGSPRPEGVRYLLREVAQARNPYGHPNIIRAQLLHWPVGGHKDALDWRQIAEHIHILRATAEAGFVGRQGASAFAASADLEG